MKKAFWILIFVIVTYTFGHLGYKLCHASLPTPDSPIELYATETLHDLQTTYTQAIDEAERSIHLIIYSLKDKKVIHALRRAAERGVKVQIICDKNASSGVAAKVGKDVKVTFRDSKRLMHQKILVVDQVLILCGSANLTTASLKMHGNLVVGVFSPLMAGDLLRKFNAMQNEGLVEPTPKFERKVNGQNLEFWFFPDNANGVDQIKKMIRSAEKSIRIAMFTWTRFDLADAVISAKKRGVDVEIILDRNASNGVSQMVAQKLIKGGISVRVNQGQELLHHKFLLIDNETLLNGSANWTKAAFTSNDDFFLILSPLTDSQRKTLEEMWKEINLHSKNI